MGERVNDRVIFTILAMITLFLTIITITIVTIMPPIKLKILTSVVLLISYIFFL